MLLRTQVDRITGQLSDTRTRFLGTRPPKLFAANVKGQRSMLSLSSRPWLGYSDMGRYNLTPLSYEALDYASGLPVSPHPLHASWTASYIWLCLLSLPAVMSVFSTCTCTTCLMSTGSNGQILMASWYSFPGVSSILLSQRAPLSFPPLTPNLCSAAM